MKWSQVCEDKTLQDLPYKVELNQWGQIVMSPASNKHGRYQSRLNLLASRFLKTGETISECSIATPKGVKVADVAWASEKFIRKYSYRTPYPAAPELCIEIVSPSNSSEEIQEKIALYLAKGAREVWVCNEEGEIDFYAPKGRLLKSKLAPRFPQKL